LRAGKILKVKTSVNQSIGYEKHKGRMLDDIRREVTKLEVEAHKLIMSWQPK
jgi:hypothetical protein